MNNVPVIVFFKQKITTYVPIATVILVFVGFYGRENMWMKINQDKMEKGIWNPRKSSP